MGGRVGGVSVDKWFGGWQLMFAGDNVQESIRETAQQFVLASTTSPIDKLLCIQGTFSVQSWRRKAPPISQRNVRVSAHFRLLQPTVDAIVFVGTMLTKLCGR